MCELGKIIALIKKLGGGSGPSVQSDWNQNDSTAADYVKNRPCYESQELTEILPETTATAVLQDGFNTANITGVSPFVPVLGATYEIGFDGVLYTCEAQTSPIGGTGIGEVAETGLDFTNYPFYIMQSEIGVIFFAETAGTHTISISEKTVSIVPLDPKFIPELPADGLVVASSTPSSTKKFKITVDDTGTISATEV